MKKKKKYIVSQIAIGFYQFKLHLHILMQAQLHEACIISNFNFHAIICDFKQIRYNISIS